ncbi:hypothetical protein EU805_06465 [Salipiger sp. IMCC34102]|uniref:hypothetical protein n=1 Tax=Salipiger sp. IMCC34102 TaxID=2510647 RepID=UPI00101B75C6|nr:hypothetical protein [Salipiger sp. IMCC34102]RYH03363.1 hypothetical protein EU805_06465 [Salipiger sp. IMCC34102]
MSIMIVTERDGPATINVSLEDNLNLKATASRAFIDQHVGEGANGNRVTQWFTERSSAVEAAVKAKHDGGTAEAPFDQLTLEGMQ